MSKMIIKVTIEGVIRIENSPLVLERTMRHFQEMITTQCDGMFFANRHITLEPVDMPQPKGD